MVINLPRVFFILLPFIFFFPRLFRFRESEINVLNAVFMFHPHNNIPLLSIFMFKDSLPVFLQFGFLYLVDERGTGFPSRFTHQQYPVPWWHWMSTYWPFSLQTGTKMGIPDSLLVLRACSRSSRHLNSSEMYSRGK